MPRCYARLLLFRAQNERSSPRQRRRLHPRHAMPFRPAPPPAAALLFVAALSLLAACDSKKTDVAAAPGGASAPAGAAASAPPVGVTTVRASQRDLPVLITATGSVAPLA